MMTTTTTTTTITTTTMTITTTATKQQRNGDASVCQNLYIFLPLGMTPIDFDECIFFIKRISIVGCLRVDIVEW